MTSILVLPATERHMDTLIRLAADPSACPLQTGPGLGVASDDDRLRMAFNSLVHLAVEDRG